jgi:Trypsin
MRKKLVFVVFSVIAILAIAVSPAYAITGDWQRDFEHPFVGLAVFYNADGEFIWRCSGTLLDSTTFLTAGHCADTEGGAVTARIYFQQDAGAHFDPTTQVDPVTGYPETCAGVTFGVTCMTVGEGNIHNFGFTGALTIPNTHDAGILILDQPIELSEYGQLPDARVLDGLATARGTKDTIFTVSGYGLTYKNQLQNGKPNISFRERLMAEAKLVNVNSMLNAGFNLQTQGNGTGLGGTCNGDSGGPVFLGHTDSNLVVGITSFGLNALCRGADFAFRVDQPDVLAWIQSYMQ